MINPLILLVILCLKTIRKFLIIPGGGIFYMRKPYYEKVSYFFIQPDIFPKNTLIFSTSKFSFH